MTDPLSIVWSSGVNKCNDISVLQSQMGVLFSLYLIIALHLYLITALHLYLITVLHLHLITALHLYLITTLSLQHSHYNYDYHRTNKSL